VQRAGWIGAAALVRPARGDTLAFGVARGAANRHGDRSEAIQRWNRA